MVQLRWVGVGGGGGGAKEAYGRKVNLYTYTVDMRFCACLVWSQVCHSVPFLFVGEV